jgi:hypothetical protein
MGLKNESRYRKIERFAHEESQVILASHKFEHHRSAAVANGSFQGLRHVLTGCYRSPCKTVRGRLYWVVRIAT